MGKAESLATRGEATRADHSAAFNGTYSGRLDAGGMALGYLFAMKYLSKRIR